MASIVSAVAEDEPSVNRCRSKKGTGNESNDDHIIMH